MKTFEIPLNENDMTSMNPKVRVAPAKQGVYLPMYNEGPTFPWARGADFPTLGSPPDVATSQNFLVAPNFSAAFLPTLAPSALPELLVALDTTRDRAMDDFIAGFITVPTTPQNPYSWGHSGEMVGVSLYRGLNNAASLTIKMVLGVEIAPSPTSPIRQFVVDPPGYDPRALQLYFDLVHDMPHSYPASSNFLNAIISAAQTLLPILLPHIPAVISGIGQLFGRPPQASSQPEMRDSAHSRITAPPQPAATRGVRVKKNKRVVKVRGSSVASRASRGSRRGSSTQRKR